MIDSFTDAAALLESLATRLAEAESDHADAMRRIDKDMECEAALLAAEQARDTALRERDALAARTMEIVDDEDGQVSLDADFARDCMISFTLSAGHIGWSAVVGRDSAHGSTKCSLPRFVVDALRAAALRATPPPETP
jgi:hypothetical protein